MSNAVLSPAPPTGDRAAGDAPAGDAPPDHGTGRGVLVVAGTPLAVAVCTFLAALPWLRAYHQSWTAVVLAAAAVVSVAVPVVVGRLARRPPVVSYAVSLAALVVTLVVGVDLHPSLLARGVSRGPTILFTDTLPLISPRWLLVPPVVGTWLTGAAAGELAVRGRRIGPVLGVLVLSFAGAFACTAGAPGRDTWSGALLLVGLAVVAVARRVTEGARASTPVGGAAHTPWRALGAGLGIVVLVALVAALVVPAAPGMSGRPDSINRPAPVTSGEAVSPVAAIADLRDGDPQAPPTALFDVTTSGPSDGYLTVASLDDFNGDSWSLDATFAPTGGRIPVPVTGVPQPGGTTVTGQVTLLRSLGPDLPFIPYLDRPVATSGLALDADPTSGMVLPATTPSYPARYSIEARQSTATLSSLHFGSRVSAEVPAADSAVPPDTSDVVTGVLRWAAALTGGRPAPDLAYLAMLADRIRATDRRVNPSVTTAGQASATRGGTSLAEVIPAVTLDGQATPEQYATIFVLAARSLGVPARLATGFRLARDASTPLAPGTYRVTNRQAWTWAEVPVAGQGWVVVDPTPSLVTAARAAPQTGAQTSATTVPPAGATAVPRAGTGGHALAPAGHPVIPVVHHRSVLVRVVAAVGIALVVALAIGPAAAALAALRRRRRRRGRRSPDPAESAVGAWLEALDALEEVGMVVSRQSTAAEVAVAAADRFGPEVTLPLHRVGTLAERALCSTRHPPDRVAADSAWAAQDEIRRQVRAQLSPRDRARASLSVGTHSRRPVRPPAGRRG